MKCVFSFFFLTHSFHFFFLNYNYQHQTITCSLVLPSVIIDVIIADVDLQWAPLPKLLRRRTQSANSHEEAIDEQDAVFTVVCMFLTRLF